MGILNSASETGAVARQMGAAVRLYPALCLSLACYWFWQGSLFQSPQAFLESGSASSGGMEFWPSVILLSFSLAAYVVLALMHGRLRPLMVLRGYPVAIALLMGVGGAVVVSGMSSGIVTALSLAALGVGAPLFVCELGRLFAQLGPNRTLYVGGLGTLGGMLLRLLFDLLPHLAFQCAIAISAPLAVALYARARSDFSRALLFPEDYAVLRSPWRFNGVCLLQGVSFGVFTVLLAESGAVGHSVAYLLASPVGVAALIVVGLLVRMDFNNLLFRTGLPLLTLGFLLVALFPETSELGGFAFNVGYCYLYVIATCICSYFGKELRCSPIWITALITAFLVGGQLAGIIGTPLLLGGAAGAGVLGGPEGPGVLSVVQIATIACCAIPVVGLFLLDKDNPERGWGAISPGEQPDVREAELRGFFADRGLTAREIDVAMLLARGLTKRYIAQRLTISEETVKTHIGNVYRKVGVHSQQELIMQADQEHAEQV